MSLLGRFILATENLVFSSTKQTFKNGVNVRYSNFGSKVQLPLPPKKPLTAYMIFCRETRKQVLQDKPSLRVPDQIKIIAEKWSHLSREMKEPYEVIARESILAYGEAHKKFYENLTPEQKEEFSRMKAQKKENRRLLKLRKALRETGLPKPAGSAYNLFIRSQAKLKVDVKGPAAFIKEVAELWNNLPEDKKKEFQLKAQNEKERYMLEMQNWKDKLVKENKINLLKDFEEMKARGKFALSLPESKEKIIETKSKNLPKN